RTIMGMATPLAGGNTAPSRNVPGPDLDPSAARTVVGVAGPTSPLAGGAPPSRAAPGASGTMIGVAMPGIAPLPPEERGDDAYVPAGELGATIAPHPQEVAWTAPPMQRQRRRGAPAPAPAVAAAPRPPKRAVAIVIAAGVLA